MKLSKQEERLITKYVQIYISLDWPINLTKELHEIEQQNKLLELQEYYNKKAIDILRNSGASKITVYPTQNRTVTLSIKK